MCSTPSGHDLDASLVQFTGDALLVAKHLLLDAAADHPTTADAVGALYLMYAIYFKQPTQRYCKIRCTQPEWRRVRDLHTALLAAQPLYDQARLILWKLIRADAFRFVECEAECGFETYLLSADRQPGARRFASIDHSIGAELKSLRSADGAGGLVPALQLLQAGYNEMKGHLDGGGGGGGDALLQPTTAMDAIVAGIANIEQIFDIESAEAKRERVLLQRREPTAADDCADATGLDRLVEYSIGERRQRLKAGAGAAVATPAAAAAAGPARAQPAPDLLQLRHPEQAKRVYTRNRDRDRDRAAPEPNELQVRQEKAKRVYMRRRERALQLNEANMADVRRVDEQEEQELLIGCMRSHEENKPAAAGASAVRVVDVAQLAEKAVRQRRVRPPNRRSASNPHKICVLTERQLDAVLQTPAHQMQYVSCRNGAMRVQLHQHQYEFVCNKSGDHYYRCVETVSAAACAAHILVRGSAVYVIEGQHTHPPAAAAATAELPELGEQSEPVPVLPIAPLQPAAAVEPAAASPTAEPAAGLPDDALAAPAGSGDRLQARMANKVQQLQTRSDAQKKL